jgi:alanyl-tRNA synthetase
VSLESLLEVESLVNRNIRENLPLTTEIMDRESAEKTGAMAIFEERYGERVRLVRIGEGVSLELCGGTHTARTGDIGLFKITGESAVAANLRRIEALTGEGALNWVQDQDQELRSISLVLKTGTDKVVDRIEKLIHEQKKNAREIETLKSKLLSRESGNLLSGLEEVKGTKLLVKEVEADSPKVLREFADRVKEKLDSGIIVLGAKRNEKAMLLCLVTDDLTGRYKAGEIVRHLSERVGGKGGGRPDMAQGGGNRPEELERALKSVRHLI